MAAPEVPQGGWNPLVKPFWTIGNHGNFTLSTESLKGKTAATVVDIPNKKITVPWGVRNEFYFLDNFVESLVWHGTIPFRQPRKTRPMPRHEPMTPSPSMP